MSVPSEQRIPRRVALRLAALGLLLSGCGLAEYENKMSSEMTRIERVDRESSYLGAPLVMPPMPKKDDKEEQETRWDIFLRPPRNISPTHNTKQGLARGLAQYDGSSPFQALFLGAPGTRKEFLQDVMGMFPGLDAANAKPFPVEGPEGKIEFRSYTLEGAESSVAAYFHPPNDPKVAIVFRLAKGPIGSNSLDAIRVSLSTLALDNKAIAQRMKYQEQNRKAAGK